MKFVATKKGTVYDNKFFSPLSFVEGFWIRGPGSGMGKKSGSVINISDPQH